MVVLQCAQGGKVLLQEDNYTNSLFRSSDAYKQASVRIVDEHFCIDMIKCTVMPLFTEHNIAIDLFCILYQFMRYPSKLSSTYGPLPYKDHCA